MQKKNTLAFQERRTLTHACFPQTCTGQPDPRSFENPQVGKDPGPNINPFGHLVLIRVPPKVQ